MGRRESKMKGKGTAEVDIRCVFPIKTLFFIRKVYPLDSHFTQLLTIAVDVWLEGLNEGPVKLLTLTYPGVGGTVTEANKILVIE